MKKLFSLMLGLMLALGAVAGAGAEGGKTLEVWYALSGASGEAFLSVVDDFNAQNTGISINASYSGGYTDTATKITAALLSNTTPDVLIGGPGYLYRCLWQLLRRGKGALRRRI